MSGCITCRMKAGEALSLGEKRRAVEADDVCLQCRAEFEADDWLELKSVSVMNNTVLIGMFRYMDKPFYPTSSVVPPFCPSPRLRRDRKWMNSHSLQAANNLRRVKSVPTMESNAPRVIKTKWYDYGRYKFSAERRGKEWDLTKEEYYELVNYGTCFYCQRDFDKAIGIDRFDNSIGYTYTNCVPCCTACNYSKGTRDQYEFLEENHERTS